MNAWSCLSCAFVFLCYGLSCMNHPFILILNNKQHTLDTQIHDHNNYCVDNSRFFFLEWVICTTMSSDQILVISASCFSLHSPYSMNRDLFLIESQFPNEEKMAREERNTRKQNRRLSFGQWTHLLKPKIMCGVCICVCAYIVRNVKKVIVMLYGYRSFFWCFAVITSANRATITQKP